MTTVEILKQMLVWILENTDAKNPTEVARAAGLNPVSMSKIRNGKTKRVKLETLRAVNAAYGNVFNPAWLRGESDVMLKADLARDSTPAPEQPSGCPGWAKALLVSKDETITAQKRELAAKDALIANLQQQLTDLRTQLAVEKGLLTGTSPLAPADPERGQPYV